MAGLIVEVLSCCSLFSVMGLVMGLKGMNTKHTGPLLNSWALVNNNGEHTFF